MRNIINLKRWLATVDEAEEGVLDLWSRQSEIRDLLIFESIPDASERARRASALTMIAVEGANENGLQVIGQAVLIEGPGWFMADLSRALRIVGMVPVYSFSIIDDTEEGPRKTLQGFIGLPEDYDA